MRLSLAVVVVGVVFASVFIQGRGLPSRGRGVEEVHPEAAAEPLGVR
jgi:hypothetical protein